MDGDASARQMTIQEVYRETDFLLVAFMGSSDDWKLRLFEGGHVAGAEKEMLEGHVERDSAPLCGNSVWQDRRFLSRYMPTLENYLHYRIIDVSSVKELARRWRPEIMAGFSKKNSHTALADIRESIEELKYYREHFLKLD